MKKIAVSEAFLTSVAGFLEQTEIAIYAHSGVALGRFRREPTCEEIEEAIRQCPHTEEELAELRNQQSGRPLQDILADLERRWGKPAGESRDKQDAFRMTIDVELEAKLREVTEMAELVDRSGRKVGYFHPFPL